MIRRVAWTLLVPFFVACSSDPSALAPEGTGAAETPIINGKPSDASQNAVVLLVHFDPKRNEFAQCTATTLGPSVVLTARHCVSQTDLSSACGEDGKPIQGGHVYRDYSADTMYVFEGTNRPNFNGDVKSDGRGAQIFHPDANTLCNQDIAIIVLAAPIPDAQILPIRLDSPPSRGEIITSVGWGVTQTTPFPNVRQQRTGVTIEEVGPFSNNVGETVGPNEFSVGESICSGDSGGPALDGTTNAVVGVVSRGGNGQQEDPNNPATQCLNASNLYTEVAPFKDLILQAFDAAGEEPWIEGGPDPRKAKLGEGCDTPDACRSNLCVDGVCAQDCATEGCPDGFQCTAKGGQQVCVATPASNGADGGGSSGCGCVVEGATGTSAGALGVSALALTIGIARRRRRRPAP